MRFFAGVEVVVQALIELRFGDVHSHSGSWAVLLGEHDFSSKFECVRMPWTPHRQMTRRSIGRAARVGNERASTTQTVDDTAFEIFPRGELQFQPDCHPFRMSCA